jgi:imidazolonepropionase-like amidohydrolase
VRSELLPLAAAILLPLAGCAYKPASEPLSAPLVLRGVTVIDGIGGPPVADMDVVVEGARIAAIYPSGSQRYAADARVHDLRGRYLIPGLVDTHAHVTVLRWLPDESGRRRGVYDRGVSERTLRVLLAHGITAVRNPSAPAAEGVALRDDVASGLLVGPRIVTSGEHLNDSRMSEEEIRVEVRRQVALGVDLIKAYAGLTPTQLGVLIDEAHALGVRVVGHLQRTTWTEAARLGIDAITHGSPWSQAYLPEHRRAQYRQTLLGRLDWLEWVDLDGPEIREMIQVLVDEQIPLDPTLIAYHTKFFGDDPRYLDHPEHHLVPEIVEDWRGGTHTDGWTAEDYGRAKRLWPRAAELVRRYHEAGVLLSAGSDLPVPWVIPGVGLHEELELLVAAGIPPLEVLTIATRNGAETLGLLDEIGTVEAGKRADLLVLSADPTADIRNTRSIEAVIQGGEVMRPAELLGGTDAASGPSAGAASDRRRRAPEAVP